MVPPALYITHLSKHNYSGIYPFVRVSTANEYKLNEFQVQLTFAIPQE